MSEPTIVLTPADTLAPRVTYPNPDGAPARHHPSASSKHLAEGKMHQ